MKIQIRFNTRGEETTRMLSQESLTLLFIVADKVDVRFVNKNKCFVRFTIKKQEHNFYAIAKMKQYQAERFGKVEEFKEFLPTII